MAPCLGLRGGDGLGGACPFGGVECQRVPMEPPCMLDCERLGVTITYSLLKLRIAATTRFTFVRLSVLDSFL